MLRHLEKCQRANYRLYQGGFWGQVLQVALAVGGAILGKRASDKASDQSSADRQRELDLEERRIGIAETQDERAGQLFEQYQEQYAPREQRLLEEAFDRPISPAAAEARATTDVRSSLETARQMGDRNLRRLGVNPNSGAYVGLDRVRNLEGAKIEAGARTRAREGTRGLNFARQASVIGLGRGLPSQAAGFAAQAGAGYGSAASLAGARASDSAALAQQAGRAYGSAIGNVISTGGQMLSDWWKNRQEPETTPTPKPE